MPLDVLMEVNVLLVEECDNYLVNATDGDGFLCAQGNGTDACGKDRGGPLFYSDGGRGGIVGYWLCRCGSSWNLCGCTLLYGLVEGKY